MSSKTKNHFIARFLLYLLLIAALIYTLVPFATILITSFRTSKDAVRGPFTWPRAWNIIDNYIQAWKVGGFSKYMLNSLYMMVLTVVGTLAVATLAGYSFAKFN